MLNPIKAPLVPEAMKAATKARQAEWRKRHPYITTEIYNTMSAEEKDEYNAIADACDSKRKRNIVEHGTADTSKILSSIQEENQTSRLAMGQKL